MMGHDVFQKRAYNSYKTFVKVYLSSKTDQDVADKLGIKKLTVIENASRLRRWGIKLPMRVNRRPVQEFVDELNDIIKTFEDTPRPPKKPKTGDKDV